MKPQRRPTASQRTAFRAVLAVLLALCAAPLAQAQQISYTIQVVALSDMDSAIDTQGQLLRQGFPAYVVRSTSSQGAVYRVRVGAFANRPAALLYAEAMPHVAGGQPVPALAEGIPAGLTPLTPRLVLSQELTGMDARLVLVGDALALRTQQRTPLAQAEYAVITGGAVERVSAWQLSLGPEGQRVLVRDMRLWPDTWQEEPEEVLEGYQTSLLTLVAERLGLDPATVRAARYGVGSGPPRLIVVEREAPEAPDGTELLGLGLPASGMTPAGPLQFLGLQPEDLPGLPDGVRFDLASGTVAGALQDPVLETAEAEPGDGTGEEPPAAPAEEPGEEPPADEPEQAPPGGPVGDAEGDPESEEPLIVQGEGWWAEEDGPFIRLTVPPRVEGTSATSWRAALGTPLWSGAGYLVAYEDRTLLIYDFLPRD